MDWQAMYSDVRELPYYKPIVQCVLRKQLQQLLEEISSEVGEESLIMTVNPQTGTISHHGSQTGKAFLQNRDDLKTQFLAFCVTNAGSFSSSNIEEQTQTQTSERRKRKNTARDKTKPAKQQKTGSGTAKSPSLASETPQTSVNTSVSKKTFPQDDSFETISNQVLSKAVSSDCNVSKKQQANQVMPDILTVNQNSFPQESSRPPQLLCTVTEGRTSISASLESIAMQQIKDDHPYSKDKNKTSEGNDCNDKDSLTNYYLGSNTNENQLLEHGSCEVKQEVKPEGYDLENNVVCDGSDWTISVNSSDSAGNIVQGDDVGAFCDVYETVEQSETVVQLNGADIDYKLPELQPIVRLDMCNTAEKSVTALPNLTRTIQNTPGAITNISDTQVDESDEKFIEESLVYPSSSNAAETKETSNEITVFLEEIESDMIKIEPLSDFDSPMRSTSKKHVSISETLCDLDNPVRETHKKHVAISETLCDFESHMKDASKTPNVALKEPSIDLEDNERDAHETDVSISEPLTDCQSAVRKSSRKRRVSTKFLNMDKEEDDDEEEGQGGSTNT